MGGAGSHPGHEVDEVSGVRDLCADVAELREDAVEEGVLLTEGLVFEIGVSGRLLRLVRHVCIGDFRQRDEEEDNGQQEDEDGDSEIDPLY